MCLLVAPVFIIAPLTSPTSSVPNISPDVAVIPAAEFEIWISGVPDSS